MYGFSVLLHGVTGSFREPSSHLYQATLPLPPVSALVGMAGAAVGKRFEKAWPSFMAMGLFVGASGTVKGRGIDLWRYRKVSQAKEKDKKDSDVFVLGTKAIRSAVLNREFLVYPRITAFYASKDRGKIADLREAFTDPIFAISLGNSDEIACAMKVSEVCEVEELKETTSFRDTFLHGDHADDVRFDWEALKRSGVAQPLRAPLVRPLIVDFAFDGAERHASCLQPFTFLSGYQCLGHPQRAFQFDGGSPIPLYGLREGSR